MTPEAMARLHARAFVAPPRPWTAVEFQAFREDPNVVFHLAPQGFLVGRTAGPEAEVLTLCTDPAHRRAGCARGLMAAFEAAAQARGVEEVFLEVAETNTAARALYDALGYRPKGYRRDYYTDKGQARVHAHVLSKALL